MNGQLQIPGQLRILDGLEYVADDPVGQGLLGVGKFREAADDDGLDVPVHLVDLLAEGQAVQLRHADVGDDNIYRILLNVLQRL